MNIKPVRVYPSLINAPVQPVPLMRHSYGYHIKTCMKGWHLEVHDPLLFDYFLFSSCTDCINQSECKNWRNRLDAWYAVSYPYFPYAIALMNEKRIG